MKSYTPVCWLVIVTLLLLAGTHAIAADHAVVLQYHHVSGQTPVSTSISPEQFEQHLEYLQSNHYTVWSLEKIVTTLKEGKSLPEKCVALTFDDAYKSVFSRAWPLLRKRGWPFTVFVATEGVDRGYKSYMTWNQMREMAGAGVSFAGHTHTHPYMIRLKKNESSAQWVMRMNHEILTASRRLKEELGANSILFAYPFGEYNLALKRLVVELGFVGIGQHSGAVWAGSDFSALPRFPMSGAFADLKGFKRKVNSLPLPVIKEEPEEPHLSQGESRPTLRLTLAPGDYVMDAIACYASGQGKIPVRWVDREKRILECRAGTPLPAGRSRYNCTAPHRRSSRYFWFSRQWVR